MNSHDIGSRLESLSLDMALGYTERLRAQHPADQLPQYTEHYFLVRRAAKPSKDLLRSAPG
jgi:hypothetical protein